MTILTPRTPDRAPAHARTPTHANMSTHTYIPHINKGKKTNLKINDGHLQQFF